MRAKNKAAIVRNAFIWGGCLALVALMAFLHSTHDRPPVHNVPRRDTVAKATRSPIAGPAPALKTSAAAREPSPTADGPPAEPSQTETTPVPATEWTKPPSDDDPQRVVPRALSTLADALSPAIDAALAPRQKVNPPPTTSPRVSELRYQGGTIQIRVLPDGKSSDRAISGYTIHTLPPYRFPMYQCYRGSTRIARFDRPFTFQGDITIQTMYGLDASQNMYSRYGRGTTDEDRRNGDVTLGFHESCHRRDYMEYLTTHPLPEVKLTVGMTVRQYETAVKSFRRELDAYMAAMDDYSFRKTDEVGVKRSTFKTNASE